MMPSTTRTDDAVQKQSKTKPKPVELSEHRRQRERNQQKCGRDSQTPDAHTVARKKRQCADQREYRREHEAESPVRRRLDRFVAQKRFVAHARVPAECSPPTDDYLAHCNNIRASAIIEHGYGCGRR